MRVLIDSNLILELFINHNGYAKDAERVLSAANSKKNEIYVSDLCFQTICFYIEKLDLQRSKDIISQIEKILGIINIKHKHIVQAFANFNCKRDSAIEIACAIDNNIGAIVTHNPQDFSRAKLSVLSVSQLLERQELEETLEMKQVINQSLLLFIPEFDDLRNSNFRYKNLSGKNFVGINLMYSDLRYTHMIATNLSHANLYSSDLTYSKMRDVNLRSANLRNTVLYQTELCNANLRGADLRNADLRGADLRGADLRGADLRNADFKYADLIYADLSSTKMKNTNFEGAVTELN